MKNIKLIINNDIKKEKVKFFVKKELKCILNLYNMYIKCEEILQLSNIISTVALLLLHLVNCINL